MKIKLTNADTAEQFEVDTAEVVAYGSSEHNKKITNCIRLQGSATDVFIVEDYAEIKDREQ